MQVYIEERKAKFEEQLAAEKARTHDALAQLGNFQVQATGAQRTIEQAYSSALFAIEMLTVSSAGEPRWRGRRRSGRGAATRGGAGAGENRRSPGPRGSATPARAHRARREQHRQRQGTGAQETERARAAVESVREKSKEVLLRMKGQATPPPSKTPPARPTEPQIGWLARAGPVGCSGASGTGSGRAGGGAVCGAMPLHAEGLLLHTLPAVARSLRAPAPCAVRWPVGCR
jgi:hypothetical protein